MNGRITWQELWFEQKWNNDFKKRMNEVMDWKLAYSIRNMIRVYLRDHVQSIMSRTILHNPRTVLLPDYKFSVTAEMAVEHLSQINPQEWLPKLPFSKREEMLIHLRNELINPLIAQLSESLPNKYQFHQTFNEERLLDISGNAERQREKEIQSDEDKLLEADRWQTWGDYGLLEKKCYGYNVRRKNEFEFRY